MRWRWLGLLAAFVSSPALAQVAVVVDGGDELTRARHELLAKEVADLTRDDRVPIALPSAPTHVGDFTLDGARAQLRAALDDPKTKVVVGFGFLVGVAVGELEGPPKKPVLLPFATPEMQGLPGKEGRSGVRNLTYLTGLFDFHADLVRFREVIRDRRVGFVVDEEVWRVIQTLAPAVVKRELGMEKNLEMVPVPPSAAGALAAIPERVQAVYLPPHFRMPLSEMQGLIDGLTERKIPTYAGMGADWVKRGAFVTLVPAGQQTQRFRRIALYLRDALSGERLDTLPTTFPRRTELVINMATAKRIDVYPSFALMTEARLEGQEGKSEDPPLSLRAAVEEALQKNPALRSAVEQVSAARAELRESRGNLLPNVSVNGDFTWLDPDVATPFGNAERTLSWGAQASQVLYNPLAFQAYFAQKDLFAAAERGLVATRLDLVLEVVQSYLAVLQTEAIERLNRDNLRRIRTNRSLAEMRVEIGSSGPQDVARWDLELAGGRADTIQASATRNQAEIDLNRIRNVHLERAFATVSPGSTPEALIVDPRVGRFVEDPRAFKIFRNFMSQEALANSPELAQLDAQLKAQDNLLAGYKQQLYIPSVAASFGFTHVLDRSGEGTGDPMIEGFPPRDDFTWQGGLGLSFTLYDDIRYGTIQRIERTRAQLVAQRVDVANRVEQRMRSALHQAGASRAAVGLRRDAVTAARINLDAVTSAYTQGTATIITLIDAQTQSLQAEINAANALYQYLSDFAAVERASGDYGFLAPEEERKEFVRRLEAYAAEARSEEASP